MNDEPVKVLGDVTSAGILVATITNNLPTIAALISIVWALIRLMETDTFQAVLFRATGFDLKAWLSARPKKDQRHEKDEG